MVRLASTCFTVVVLAGLVQACGNETLSTAPQGQPSTQPATPAQTVATQNPGTVITMPNLPLGGISGLICAGDPSDLLGGAVVSVQTNPNDSSTLVRAVTASDGSFSLVDIPIGTWTLSISKGSFSTSTTATVTAGSTFQLPAPICVSSSQVKIAVVSGNWDRIEAVLQAFQVQNIDVYDGLDGEDGPAATLLGSPETLAQYQILFIACGASLSLASNPANVANVAAFVEAGGSLYVSDMAYGFISSAWPDAVVFYTSNAADLTGAGYGYPVTNLQATVSADLGQELGTTNLSLNFAEAGWAIMAEAGPQTTVEVSGSPATCNWTTGCTTEGPSLQNIPLLVRFTAGQGKVTYTSFHTEGQPTVELKPILSQVVFSL